MHYGQLALYAFNLFAIYKCDEVYSCVCVFERYDALGT